MWHGEAGPRGPEECEACGVPVRTVRAVGGGDCGEGLRARVPAMKVMGTADEVIDAAGCVNERPRRRAGRGTPAQVSGQISGGAIEE